MNLSPASLLATSARRLSALDGSFLRLESADAHMHVGWSAVFSVPEGHPRPTLEALRDRVEQRLPALDWCRWRLQRAPLGLSEPRWVNDDRFELATHVRALSQFDEQVGYERLAHLRDELLSRPLDHSRAPWEIYLIPRLEDGRVAMLGKIHHSLVDGIAALQIVGLILDETDGGDDDEDGAATAPISTSGAQGHVGWAVDELKHAAGTGLSAVRTVAGAAGRPDAAVRSVVRDAQRVFAANEAGPGNKISMVYIRLPVDLASPIERLKAVRAEMQSLKGSGRAEGTVALYAVSSLVPPPLRSPVVRALSSPKVFNLTVSQSPGPRGDVHVLGCQMEEVYSVVPIAAEHSLAIGMVRYRRELFIGCYADPVALPEVNELPELIDAELRALAEQSSGSPVPVAGDQPV